MVKERAVATRPATSSVPVTIEPEKALTQYRERGYNVVVASMNLNVTDPRMMLDFKIIQVNPNPAGGEVFETGYNSGKFALQRPALERIAICSGLVWDPRETKVIRAERDYVLFQAVGHMRSDSGESITLTGTKEIDMTVIEDEMRAEQTVKVFNEGNREYKTWNRKVTYEELSPEKQAKADGLIRREVTVFRKHKLARAETGAKLRAIRSIGLKSSYTAAEIQKPFVIARIVPNPHNPMVRASMQAAALALYGDPTAEEKGREKPENGRGPFDVEYAETEDIANGDGTEPEPAQEPAQAPEPPSDPAQAENAQQAEPEPAQAAARELPSDDQAKRFVELMGWAVNVGKMDQGDHEDAMMWLDVKATRGSIGAKIGKWKQIKAEYEAEQQKA